MLPLLNLKASVTSQTSYIFFKSKIFLLTKKTDQIKQNYF